MVESVNCPKCATHYALRPMRVQPRHRRAKCFTCDQIFSITEEVQRLLATDAPGAPGAHRDDALYAQDDFGDLNDQSAATVGVGAPDLGFPAASAPGIIEDEVHAAFLDEGTATADGPLVSPEATDTFSEGSPTHLPALTLQDLEETDSAMEKTLVLNQRAHPEHRTFSGFSEIPTHSAEELEALGMGGPPPMPESLAESAPGMEAEPTSTYSSARDAIDKLMAGTPSVQRVRPQSMSMRGGAPMDVETTLDALELTLGGNPAPQFDASEETASTPAQPPMEWDEAMSAQTAQNEASASTRLMRLDEIPSAPSSPQAPTMMMPRPTFTAPPSEAPTVALPMPMPMPMPQMPPPMPMPAPTLAPRAEVVKDPNLLKIQLETETLSNVTMDQLILLVEQGRVKEYHLVARQFSENWLEANKVPTLRPVFERLRRATQIGPVPTLSNETAPVKKSLFGGLFGRN